jgi:hypothetical protein
MVGLLVMSLTVVGDKKIFDQQQKGYMLRLKGTPPSPY